MQLNDSYDAIYERANTLVAEGQWEDAVDTYGRIFNRIGKLSPETRAKHAHLNEVFERTSFELTTLLNRMGEYDRAIEILQRLMEMAPENRPLWRREIARYRVEMGDVSQGLAELQVLVEENTDDVFAILGLGQAYAQLKDYDQAVVRLEQCVKMAKEQNIPELETLGRQQLFDIYSRTGRVQEAAAVWETVIAADQSLQSAVSLLYDLYLDHDELDKARALIIQDQNPLRRGLYLGHVARREGDLDAAAAWWEKVVRREIDQDSQSVESWMEAGLRVGQAQRVIQSSLPILSSGKLNLQASILFAVAWAMLGETERADSFLGAVRENLIWRRNGKLGRDYWGLAEDLLPDETVRAVLKHHFEGSEESDAGEAEEEKQNAEEQV